MTNRGSNHCSLLLTLPIFFWKMLTDSQSSSQAIEMNNDELKLESIKGAKHTRRGLTGHSLEVILIPLRLETGTRLYYFSVKLNQLSTCSVL